MRYLLQLSFVGTRYHGWQVQKNANSVQAELNKALGTILNAEVESTGCGRTDTGVHATQFFANFDTAAELPQHFLTRLNKLLPHDIAVQNIFSVRGDFSARFDADYRIYHYIIYHNKDPFLRERGYHLYRELDVEMMNLAAAELMNYREFTCFSKSNTQVNNYFCTIHFAYWERMATGELKFFIKANRFLRNMVRAIVGTLIQVGKGDLTVEGFRKIIENKKRTEAGMSVPACGLYLTEIGYPELKI